MQTKIPRLSTRKLDYKKCQLSARLQIYIATLVEAWGYVEGMRKKLWA